MSVDFDPVRVGPRKRRVDPLLVGLLVVVLGVTAAVLKPWDRAADPGPSSSPVVAAASPTASLLPAATSEPSVPAPTPIPIQPPTWADLGPAFGRERSWGVQTIARRQVPPWSMDDATYLGAWSPISTAEDGTGSVRTEPLPGPTVAFGLVTSVGTPLDGIRIWRRHVGGALQWMDTMQVADADEAGAHLFLRPGTDDRPYEPWQAGHYRIDVLMGTTVRRIDVELSDRTGVVPDPEPWTIDQTGIIPSSQSDPPVIFAGLFAYVDGRSVALPAAANPLLTDAEAWQDLATAGGAGIVASAYLPRASALGVMLPPGATSEDRRIRRLAPDGPFEEPEGLPGNSDRRGRSPFVVFEPPDGGVWAPGVYAISMTWTYRGSVHDDTWHVELRPGRG